jgi:hypothetical protein
MSLAHVHDFAISLDGFDAGECQSCDAHFGHTGGQHVRIGGGATVICDFLAAPTHRPHARRGGPAPASERPWSGR